jgi:dTDP-4-amino-4,6-dideoxygalactose transaminase
MIVTDNDELADRIKVLRAHGSKVKYYHKDMGYNSRLDELQAAILNVKFKYLNDWNELRRKHAYRYNELLSNYVKTPKEAEYKQYHIYHQYTVEVDNRDDFSRRLNDKGVGTMVYYPVPLHLQEVYKELGYKPGDFPNAEAACNNVLSIPISPELTIEEQDFVIEEIKRCLGE